MKARTPLALVAISFALVGCATATGPRADPAIVQDMFAARIGSVLQLKPLPATLAEALPNQRYRNVETGEEFAVSTGAVLGRITDAEVFEAWTIDSQGEAKPVALDDKAAFWRMVHVTLEVESAWGDNAGSQVVTITLPLDGAIPVELGLGSILNLDRVFVVLSGDRVFGNEALLGTVSSDGAVSFVDQRLDQPLFPNQGIDSIVELAEALDASPPIIPMHLIVGIPTKADDRTD